VKAVGARPRGLERRLTVGQTPRRPRRLSDGLEWVDFGMCPYAFVVQSRTQSAAKLPLTYGGVWRSALARVLRASGPRFV
jgi:hypothetical protein